MHQRAAVLGDGARRDHLAVLAGAIVDDVAETRGALELVHG